MKTECKRSRPAEITSEFPVPLGRLRSIDRPALCTVFARAGTAGRLYDGSNTNDPSESDKTDGVRLPGQKAHLLTNGHHRPLIFVRCYRNPNPCICLVTTARDSGARGGSRRCPSKSPPRPRTQHTPCPTGSAFRVTSRSSCSSHSNCARSTGPSARRSRWSHIEVARFHRANNRPIIDLPVDARLRPADPRNGWPDQTESRPHRGLVAIGERGRYPKTQAAAWRAACEQAQAVGMLTG